jgi:hypothetical protein
MEILDGKMLSGMARHARVLPYLRLASKANNNQDVTQD